MPRPLPTLCLGLLLLVVSCTAQVVQHKRVARSEKLLTWAIGPDQQRLLANALYRAGRVGEPSLALLQRFYYYPVVTNRQGEGLYYVTQFTHRGPVGVLRSKLGVSTIEVGLTELATQDSVASALVKHGDRIKPQLRKAILDEYRQ